MNDTEWVFLVRHSSALHYQIVGPESVGKIVPWTVRLAKRALRILPRLMQLYGLF